MPASSMSSTTSAASRRPRGHAASSSSMSGSSSSPARPASRSTRRYSKAWSTARRWCAAAGARRRFRASSRAPGDFVVEKMRMSAWEGTRLETILKATGRDMIINTGAWTNMSVEHTARTGADKGYFMIVPEDCCSTMNADWHNASINFAHAERLRRDQRRRRHQSAGMKAGGAEALASVLFAARRFRIRRRRARLPRSLPPGAAGLGHRRDGPLAAISCRNSRATSWKPNMPASAGAAFNDVAARCLCGCRTHRGSLCACRSRADLDADVEFRHSLQAEAMDRRRSRSPG